MMEAIAIFLLAAIHVPTAEGKAQRKTQNDQYDQYPFHSNPPVDFSFRIQFFIIP